MTRERQRDGGGRRGSAAVKRDESVDKVKLEIRRTDGGAKECDLPSGLWHCRRRDRQTLTVGR